MVAEKFAVFEGRHRLEQEGIKLAALKKRVAKRVERKISKVRAASSKALLLLDVASSDSISETEPTTKDDIWPARRWTAEGSSQRASTAFNIAQVAKAEAAARQVAKDIADRDFERRWHDRVTKGDPEPSTLRDGPKDVSSEQKTGMCHAAHFLLSRKRMHTHVDVHMPLSFSTQAHAYAR